MPIDYLRLPLGESREVRLAHMSEASLMLAVKKGADGYEVEKLWDNKTIRHSYDTPVYHDGHLYGYDEQILNAQSGDEPTVAPEKGVRCVHRDNITGPHHYTGLVEGRTVHFPSHIQHRQYFGPGSGCYFGSIMGCSICQKKVTI